MCYRCDPLLAGRHYGVAVQLTQSFSKRCLAALDDFVLGTLLEQLVMENFCRVVLVLLSALLAGSPEIYILSMALLVLDGIRLRWGQSARGFTWMILSIIAVNLSVVLLGMIQLLPTVELLSQSRRDGSIPFDEATLWSLQPAALIGLFFPDKEVDNSLSIGVRLYFARDIPFFLSHYLGILSLLGLSAWAWYTSCRERLLIIFLIFVSLLLALGHSTPVYRFLYEHIAVFRVIRFPEKYVFLAYALLLLVVLKGLAALHQRKNSELNFAVCVLFSLFALWTTAYLLFRLAPNRLFGLITVSPYFSNPSATSSVATTMASIFFNLERQIGITGALLVLYFCTAKGILRGSLHHGFLILIVLVDLAGVHKPLLFPLDPEALTNASRVLSSTNSKKGRLFYYPAGKNLHPSSLTVTGWPPFAKAVMLSYENLLPNAGIFYGFHYFQEIDALTRKPYNDFLDFANLISPENRIKLLRALNVHYLVAFQPLVIPGIRLVQQFPEHFSWLYELDRPLPRSYIVSRATYEDQPGKTLRLLSSDGFDPSQNVILDESMTYATNQGGGGEANIIRSSNSDVVIDASLSGPGFLVLTDSYYPGWKVYVDGSERKVLRANYFFRAVPLPAGKHKVNFFYDPASFKLGAAVSALVAALLMMISGVVYLRQRSASQRSAISASIHVGSS